MCRGYFISQERLSSPLELEPSRPRATADNAPCTVAIVAGFQVLPFWFTKFSVSHHMFKLWKVLICWESFWVKETTHIEHASSPAFQKIMERMSKYDAWESKHWPWHPTVDGIDLGIPPWTLRIFAVRFMFDSTKDASWTMGFVGSTRYCSDKNVVKSVSNFRIGNCTPLKCATQMYASQSCLWTMPFTGVLHGRFGGFSLTPCIATNTVGRQRADNGHRLQASVTGMGW